MTPSQDRLLAAIEQFLERSEMSPTAFGERVMRDRHLVRRLRDGGTVTLKTADKIRTFIEGWKPRRKKRGECRTAA